jgi:hypothetical protein
VNAEITVVENETIERALVTICRHDIWYKTQERLFGRRSNGTNDVVVILPPNHVTYIPDCCFNLRCKKSNAELACGSNGNRERFRLLFEEAFTEPNSGEVMGEIEVEQ